jgi:hypothetical protein
MTTKAKSGATKTPIQHVKSKYKAKAKRAATDKNPKANPGKSKPSSQSKSMNKDSASKSTAKKSGATKGKPKTKPKAKSSVKSMASKTVKGVKMAARLGRMTNPAAMLVMATQLSLREKSPASKRSGPGKKTGQMKRAAKKK